MVDLTHQLFDNWSAIFDLTDPTLTRQVKEDVQLDWN